jgi:hypothetical protein
VWGVALVADAAIIRVGIDLTTQSMGMMVAIGVLVYGASVHLARMPMIRFTKELQVGVLFACGVSLVTWEGVLSDPSKWLGWIVTLGLAALLFSCNCVFVAVCELPYDRAQGFDSLPAGIDGIDQVRTRLIAMTLFLAMGSATFALFQTIPSTAAIALAASSLLLGGMCHWVPGRVTIAVSNSSGLSAPSGFLADTAIFVPPLFCMLLQ